MSFETELTRVAGGAKDTLKTLITKLGGTVADEKIDNYPELAEAIEFEDIEFEEGQPKITVNGILKGDGEGNITAAIDGVDYNSGSNCDEYFEKISEFPPIAYQEGDAAYYGPIPCVLSNEALESSTIIFRDLAGNETEGSFEYDPEINVAEGVGTSPDGHGYVCAINVSDTTLDNAFPVLPHSLYCMVLNDGTFVLPASITIADQTFTVYTSEIVIKTEHLPEALRFGEIETTVPTDTITWDGDLITTTSVDGLYRVSECVVTLEQLANGYTIGAVINGEQNDSYITATDASGVSEVADQVLSISDCVYSVLQDTIIDDISFPAGIYFVREGVAYVASFTVPGAPFSTKSTSFVKMDAKYLPCVTETNKGLDQKFWRGTKEEFDAVETKSDDTLYIVTDEDGSAVSEAAVQSDWAQNDETADDYVKNRFGGYYDEVETQVWPETTLTNFEETDREGIYKSWNVDTLSMCTTDKCKLIFDGVEYIVPRVSGGDSAYGNRYLYSESNENTGEPFYCYFFVDIDTPAMVVYIYTSLPGTEHTVELYKIDSQPIPIPEEYTPTLATKESVKNAVQLKPVAYLPNELGSTSRQFVATSDTIFAFGVKYSTQTAAYKSYDNGRTWISLPDLPEVGYITYGNGQFVLAATNSNCVYYSADAETWEYTLLSGSKYRIAFGDGCFVVGCGKSSLIYYSYDGVTWTEVTTLSGETADIQYIDNRFIRLQKASDGSVGIDFSSDGITWESQMIDAASCAPDKLVGGNGKLLAFTQDYYPAASYLYSTDNGVTWTEAANDTVEIADAAYSPNSSRFVVCPGWASNGAIYYSLNLIDWFTEQCYISGYQRPNWQTVSYVGGQFLMLDTYYMAYSTNGMSWEYSREGLVFTNAYDEITDRVRVALGVDSMESSMDQLKDSVESVKPSAYLTTLTAADWDGVALTQTVTVPGIQADESKQMIIPMPTIACMTVYNEAGIQLTNQADNALTFTAQEVPAVDIQVYVSFQDVNLVTG